MAMLLASGDTAKGEPLVAFIELNTVNADRIEGSTARPIFP